MKTKLIHFGLQCWQLLTEVPGWPDAPRWMRWRRALPLVFPCVVMALLATWQSAVRDPHILAERAAHQPLSSLEEEVTSLQANCTEEHAMDMLAKSTEARKSLLNEPAELGPILKTLKKEAISRQWEANFQAGDASLENTAADAQVKYLPVRGKLSSTSANTGPFVTLLALIEGYSTTGKRIDLTRLAIRADEQGRYAVEMNLRLVCRHTNESTPQ